MAVVAMKQLLEAGVHFGHQTRRWDPKMAEYIFQARNGIHIIDLQKTSKKLDEAYKFVKDQVEEGKTVLFVGTKKQAQDAIKEAAEKCDMYYVNQRWLGGMLTNFETIRKRIERLNQLEAQEQDGTFDLLPKKEVAGLKKEMEKLEKNLGGIKNMTSMPGVMFVVDPKKEHIAILEAHKLGIPVVGLVDTNCNPEVVDYPIPGNDDAIRAVRLIADCMANAVIEGNQGEDGEGSSVKFEEVEEEKSIEQVVAEKVEEVKEETKKVAKKVADKFEEARPVVEEKTKEVKENAKKVAEKAQEKAEELKPVVEEKVKEVKENAKKVAEKAQEKAEELKPVVEEKVKEVKKAVEEKVEEVKAKTRKKAEAKKDVEEKAEEKTEAEDEEDNKEDK